MCYSLYFNKLEKLIFLKIFIGYDKWGRVTFRVILYLGLSDISYWLLVIGFQLSVISYRLLVIGFQLSVISYWVAGAGTLFL